MNNDLQIQIPEEIYVGFSQTSYTTKPEKAFVSYMKNGNYHSIAFIKWSNSKTRSIEKYDNLPRTGFKVIYCVGGSGKNDRNAKIVISDPRNFSIEITPKNFVQLLNECGYDPINGFMQPMCYGYNGSVLMLCTQKEFENYQKAKENKITISKLIPGHYYVCEKNEYSGYYLGKVTISKFSNLSRVLSPLFKTPNKNNNGFTGVYQIFPELINVHLFVKPLMTTEIYNECKQTSKKFIESYKFPVLSEDDIKKYRKNYITKYIEATGNEIDKLPKYYTNFHIDNNYKATDVTLDNIMSHGYYKTVHYFIRKDNKQIIVCYTNSSYLAINKKIEINNGALILTDYNSAKSYFHDHEHLILLDDSKIKDFYNNLFQNYIPLIEKEYNYSHDILLHIIDNNNNFIKTNLSNILKS